MGIVSPRINQTVSGTTVANAVTADDLEVDSGTLSIDADNNRVGINTNSPTKTLGIDGDLHFQPTVTSTGHITSTGSLDIQADANIKVGTSTADSIRIGRENSSACKVHIRSGSDADLVVTDGKVGIGMEDPSDALEIDGDIQLTPTATSTAHLKTTGSLDVRASGNIKIGTDGADSIRLGRVNSSAVKVHLRSGTDTDMVLFNSQLGLGTETPGTQLQLESTAPYVTLKNSTSENTAGGCESKIIFEDHGNNALGQIEVSHVGTADDEKGQLILSTNNDSGLQAAVTIDDTQTTTFGGDVVVGGTTPKLTIGDAGQEDTMLAFDGNAQDYRIGIDDGSDTLEFGVGQTHGTTTALSITADTSIEIFDSLTINSAIADEKCSGITAVFTAGEALERGEVCYFKAADSKMWKAVATASATSRCVAMAAEDISADAAGKFLLHGFLQDNGTFPAYTVGATLFTPEAETGSQNVPEEAKPDTDGDFVQVIGWAVTANMVFFNPSQDVIEVA